MCRTMSHVRIVCIIVKSKMVTTKTNSMMAYTSVEDLTGTMEVIVFPQGTLDNIPGRCCTITRSWSLRVGCPCGRMNLPRLLAESILAH